jgi:predicted transposase/invertase (TIGR01784 family)
MSFDSTCRRLAEIFPEDFASWLLGKRIALTELSPTELSIEPIRADSVMLLQGQNNILHVEFQTDPKPDIPMRLADYRLRLHRKFPDKRIHQVVIYLRETRSDRVYQNYFEIPGMYAEFNVVRLWEVSAEELIAFPGLLPFVALSRSDEPEETLRRAVGEILNIRDETQQHEAMAAAYVLAGLRLDEIVIKQVIRRDVMQESVTYQAILREGQEIGQEIGREQGREQGREEEAIALVTRQLNRRLKQELSEEMKSRFSALPRSVLEDLSEALLDFTALSDLERWLGERGLL